MMWVKARTEARKTRAAQAKSATQDPKKHLSATRRSGNILSKDRQVVLSATIRVAIRDASPSHASPIRAATRRRRA
jgi:hypothetical protein